MDVVGLAQHGLENAVATLGTATTPEHVQKLLRLSNKVVFSYDGDQAGRKAAWRALQACLPQMRDDISIRFLFLPSEHDPDSYIREFGDKGFRVAMDGAVSHSRFMLDELASRHRLDEAEGRAACAHEALPLLRNLPEGAYRLQVEREFAQQVLLTPEELKGLLAQEPAPEPFGKDTGGSTPTSPRTQPAPPFADTVEQSGAEAPPMEDDATNAWQPPMAPSQRSWAPRPAKTRFSVTPMAKQLLRLLIAHPQLVGTLGEQQLEILDRGPHLKLVRELIALIAASGARHAGALLQAAEPGTDLEEVLSGLGPQVLAEEDLPDPQTEWNDALRRIELDLIKAEQTRLAMAGFADVADQRRYQELSRRRVLLESGAQHR